LEGAGNEAVDLPRSRHIHSIVKNGVNSNLPLGKKRIDNP